MHTIWLGAADCDCLIAFGRLQANAAAEGRAGEQPHAGAATSLQPASAMHAAGAGPAVRPLPFGLTPQQQHLMLQQQFAMQQQQQLLLQQQVIA